MLKYLVVEKMALTIFGNPGFPDAKTRLDAARWRIFFFFFYNFLCALLCE